MSKDRKALPEGSVYIDEKDAVRYVTRHWRSGDLYHSTLEVGDASRALARIVRLQGEEIERLKEYLKLPEGDEG